METSSSTLVAWLRAIGSFVVASGLVWFGVGLQMMWGALDGIGYSVLDGWTWASYLYVAFCLGVVAIVTQLLRKSRFAGLLLLLSPVVFYGVMTVGMYTAVELHFPRMCDTMEAWRACETATWRQRDTCMPGDACYPRLEKACRLGSEPSCDALHRRGLWTFTDMCTTLHDRCDYTARCRAEDRVCDEPGLPAIEGIDYEHSCDSYASLCHADPVPKEGPVPSFQSPEFAAH